VPATDRHRLPARPVRTLAAGVVAAAAPGVAQAHTVVELYNPYYVAGAVVVVVVSFAILTAFVTRPPRAPAAAGGPDEDEAPAGRGSLVANLFAVLALALLVVAGFAGSPIASWNPAPVVVLAVGWSLLPALQVVAGDVWRVINPWRAGFEIAERLRRAPLAARRGYPLALGRWPAVALLLLVLLAALDRGPDWSPPLVGAVLLAYTLVTWHAMRAFGKDAWLGHGEVVTVTYRMLAGLRLGARPWGARLYATPPPGLDTTVLVLLLLAGGLARAVVETRPWASLWRRLGGAPDAAHAGPVALLALVVLVGGTYAVLCLAMRRLGDVRLGAVELARAFAPSLLPVAAVFHFASLMPHFAEDLQLLVRVVSDPLALGWNLLATRTLSIIRPPIGVVWHAQVAAVVLAHVAALYVAHLRALVVYGRPRPAVVSQLPMLVLMVLYTVSGLWVLSTVPVVMPDDVVAPAH